MKQTTSYQPLGNEAILALPTEQFTGKASVRIRKAKIEKIFRNPSTPPLKQVIHQSVTKRPANSGTPESMIFKTCLQLEDIGLTDVAIDGFAAYLRKHRMKSSTIQSMIIQVEALEAVGNGCPLHEYDEGWYKAFLPN